MGRAFLILGATSPMARAAARLLAQRGDRLFLASRDASECHRLAQDLILRHGAAVASGAFDALDPRSHGPLVDQALAFLGRLDGVLLASGYLGETPNTLDPDEASRILTANFTGLAPLLGRCAAHMAESGGGVLVGIGSVAGDRGRQSNFVYGAAKGGLDLYLQGLRHRFHGRGLRVVSFKPGFVDTAMTFGKPGTFLVADPERAGRALVRALDHGDGTRYFPWFWRWIMRVIRGLPDALFLRTKL